MSHPVDIQIRIPYLRSETEGEPDLRGGGPRLPLPVQVVEEGVVVGDLHVPPPEPEEGPGVGDERRLELDELHHGLDRRPGGQFN